MPYNITNFSMFVFLVYRGKNNEGVNKYEHIIIKLYIKKEWGQKEIKGQRPKQVS